MYRSNFVGMNFLLKITICSFLISSDRSSLRHMDCNNSATTTKFYTTKLKWLYIVQRGAVQLWVVLLGVVQKGVDHLYLKKLISPGNSQHHKLCSDVRALFSINQCYGTSRACWWRRDIRLHHTQSCQERLSNIRQVPVSASTHQLSLEIHHGVEGSGFGYGGLPCGSEGTICISVLKSPNPLHSGLPTWRGGLCLHWRGASFQGAPGVQGYSDANYTQDLDGSGQVQQVSFEWQILSHFWGSWFFEMQVLAAICTPRCQKHGWKFCWQENQLCQNDR